ncbi:PTS mannitol transporter subunit IICBA [Butyricicoccus sp.]|uniref:PTS mannitol transporter subunit IICBA n=1 Tax=Butyricicoccus sp. TaxID=2049021 RepID=UPI003F13AF96
MKQKMQSIGKALSGMVMPNIGAFIAWGFITALFIEAGWIPNAQLASIQPYMLTYLLPVLIAAQGGKMVGGDRGRVMGAIAVMGCIAGVGGTEGQPMLMGAMIMGPLAGWVIKKFDQMMEGRMPAGFEMLINNFSVGILGMIMAILGYYAIGPVMAAILAVLSAGVEFLVNHSLLPLVAVFLEPAKVLFLNNAINHGVFTPLGAEQVKVMGQSIMYMLETNPGPGLGVLLAYWMFSKDKMTKDSAPGAIIIHLFGGIHEIYFPYILMNPVVIIGPIVGNFCAILFFSITGAGLLGPAAPGSIIAFLMMTPRSSMLLSIIGVVIAAAVSFLICSPIIKMSGAKNLEESQNQMASMKAEAKGTAVAAGGNKNPADVKKVIFACDAGMGSSAMGATKFRNRIKGERPDIVVTNTSVDNVPADADIVVCQTILQERAAKSAPQAQLVTIGNFLADPKLDALYTSLANAGKGSVATAVAEPETKPAGNKTVMLREGVKLGQASVTKEEAIRAAGELLKSIGCVGDGYIEAMQEREKLVSTYMGLGVAIPHGTTQAKGEVKKSGIVMLQYPDGVDFGAEKAQLVFGIAGVGDEHLDLLANISNALEDEDLLEELKTTNDVDLILKTFS